MPRWLRLTLGIICILLGIAGTFLPILQGWLFFLLGVLLLSKDIPFFAKIADWLKARFPHATRAAEHEGKKISRKGMRRYIKEGLSRLNPVPFREESYLSNKKLIFGFIGWLVVCYGAAFVAASATPGDWYANLKKPPFNPPDWVLSVVWVALYGLMALAAWLVWKMRGFMRARIPLGLFLLQLALNVAWPWLFFSSQNPGLAFADIVALWFMLLLTLASFWIENPPAGALLVPYFGWVSYAAVINFTIWRINL